VSTGWIRIPLRQASSAVRYAFYKMRAKLVCLRRAIVSSSLLATNVELTNQKWNELLFDPSWPYVYADWGSSRAS
jgi:hypothetical protein